MDRVRRALDRARIERTERAEPLRVEPVRDAEVVQAIEPGLPRVILYTCTKTFTPAHSVLESNRVLPTDSVTPAAAAIRMLRTQVLQRMDARGWRSIAVFSPGMHDGKTTTAINLAISMATDHSHTVLLVDLDLKHPSVAQRLDVNPESGIDDVLTSNARVEDSLYHPEGFDRLVIMPARQALPNSSEVLAGPRSRELIAELRARYPERIIVFDLPPVLNADDALAFAPFVDCGLMVVAEGTTRRQDLARAMQLLRDTPIVGTVLNRASHAPRGY
ncbi:MAG TPA: CpsD/CapB family tyrosine-protein kinase [Steroidobacteraceae bacterium]|jgi:Mrp family chromosome partitioning ATPase